MTDSEFQGQLVQVLQAIDSGDFTVAMDERGEIGQAEIAALVNRITMRLNGLASEIRRVSREIGTYGVFGGQSEVYGLQGTWLDLESDFNGMAASLTDQIRDFGNITREMLDGRPARPATAPSRGETRELKERFNRLLIGPQA